MTGTSAEDAAGPAERRRRGATTLDCAHASRPRPAHSRLITCAEREREIHLFLYFSFFNPFFFTCHSSLRAFTFCIQPQR